MSKKYTRVAIAYDFDGTLAKGNIQENSFIPNLGISKDEFWKKVKALSAQDEMDEILSYMYLLINEANSKGVKIDKKSLKDHGKTVKYFEGVEGYFVRINEYAKTKQIKLEHYIISSGTKEMIQGTNIAKHFDYIYASSFKYDQHDIPEWPALAINFTTKTQFLFRINKGINNAWDNSKINDFIPEEDRPIPFRHMVYIGDGLTDIPAMKIVNMQGGISIGVYEPKSKRKGKVYKFLEQKRITYVAPADYREGKSLDLILKAVIDQISAMCSVEQFGQIKEKKQIPTREQQLSENISDEANESSL